MKKEFCAWCEKPVNVEDDFDPMKEKAVCSYACYWAEKLFCRYYSDYESAMRSYFEEE